MRVTAALLLLWGANLGAAAVHLMTVLIAFGGWGFVGGLGALVTPGLSELVMTGMMVGKYGLVNGYTLAEAAVVAAYGVAFVVGASATSN